MVFLKKGVYRYVQEGRLKKLGLIEEQESKETKKIAFKHIGG